LSREVRCPACSQIGKAYVARKGDAIVGVQVYHGGKTLHRVSKSTHPAWVGRVLKELLKTEEERREAGIVTVEDAAKLLEEHREMLQSELRRALGISSAKASRLAEALERRGLIKREPVSLGGRGGATFKLIWVGRPAKTEARAEALEAVDELIDIPCFTCQLIEACSPGANPSPASCSELTQWLLREVAHRSPHGLLNHGGEA
jgi:predicted DNA-binding transcriptional regulator